MEISPIPRVGQDSHIFVTLKGGCLNVLLALVDYDGAKSLSVSDYVLLPQNFDLDQLDQILIDFLTVKGSDYGISVNLTDNPIDVDIIWEEVKVSGATILASPEYYDDDYCSELLGSSMVLLDDNLLLNGATRYLDLISASNLVVVVLDWDEFKVLYLEKVEGSLPKVEIYRSQNNLDPGSYKANINNLLSVGVNPSEMEDLLANVFAKRFPFSNSSQIKDVLRAYTSVSLFGIKDSVFKEFGMVTEDAHLLLTGDIVRLLPHDYSMLSVIDGLQLRGRYKISVDSDNRLPVGVSTLMNRSFVLPKREIYPSSSIYLSMEKGATGNVGDRCFSGRLDSIVNVDSDPEIISESIVGQTGDIYNYSLNSNGTIYFEPGKSVYFPNLDRGKNGLVLDYDESCKNVIFDCRRIPAVYGPDVQANNVRVTNWLRGLNYKIKS